MRLSNLQALFDIDNRRTQVSPTKRFWCLVRRSQYSCNGWKESGFLEERRNRLNHCLFSVVPEVLRVNLLDDDDGDDIVENTTSLISGESRIWVWEGLRL
ncbi:hypothetical protein AVEN_262105-1 [Araneus ventricosus]|uniref:Uncharacterized protein n=1 Tax=Araneus ventricosus TaxID=182803 RepID=A0A4Y2J9E3_ARAVE|nr:hypothetical protein AVEN_262105-1 [Araneus ventricosus]